MRFTRTSFLATLLAGTLASGAALADNRPQLGTSPEITIGPATPFVVYHVICMMGSGDVMADVLIRNAGASTVPGGADIHWQVNGDIGGTFHVGRGGFAPGQVVEVGASHYPFTCTASF